jgi:hypothetical protein
MSFKQCLERTYNLQCSHYALHSAAHSGNLPAVLKNHFGISISISIRSRSVSSGQSWESGTACQPLAALLDHGRYTNCGVKYERPTALDSNWRQPPSPSPHLTRATHDHRFLQADARNLQKSFRERNRMLAAAE